MKRIVDFDQLFDQNLTKRLPAFAGRIDVILQVLKYNIFGYGTLPAVFIAMIGIDKKQQGNGIGSALVADALGRIRRVSNDIGTCAVLLDVFDDGDEKAISRRKAYYEEFGSPLPDQPLRLLMPI